jgi:hypothetical protein
MTVAIVLGFVLIIFGYKALGKGLVLGTLFSVLNFVLIGEILPMRLATSKRKAFWISFGSMLARYGLLAVPMVAALVTDGIDPISTACGLFMIQAVILADHIGGNLGLIRKKTLQG